MRDIHTPTPEELSAYLDGELDASRHAEISYYLASDRQLADYIASQRAIRDGLRALAGQGEEPSVPSRMIAAIESLRQPVRPKRWGWYQPPLFAVMGGAVAAMLMFLVWVPQFGSESQFQRRIPADTLYFLDQGAGGRQFDAASQTLISDTLPGFDVAARFTPVMENEGFLLKGGRVMAMEGAGAILLMYEDPAGEPLGLMIWRTELDPVTVTPSRTRGVETVLWTHGPFSFALTGQQDLAVLEMFRRAYLAP